MELLPNELVIEICLFLTNKPAEWARLRLVNRRWQTTIDSSPFLWDRLTYHKWVEKFNQMKSMSGCAPIAVKLVLSGRWKMSEYDDLQYLALTKNPISVGYNLHKKRNHDGTFLCGDGISYNEETAKKISLIQLIYSSVSRLDIIRCIDIIRCLCPICFDTEPKQHNFNLALRKIIHLLPHSFPQYVLFLNGSIPSQLYMNEYFLQALQVLNVVEAIHECLIDPNTLTRPEYGFAEFRFYFSGHTLNALRRGETTWKEISETYLNFF